MVILGRGHSARRSFKELIPFAQFIFYGVLLAWVLLKSWRHGPDLDRIYGPLPEWSEISGLGGILLTLILFSMGTASMMAAFVTGLWDRPSTQVTDPGAPLFITFLLIVVLAPILEELVFRGILFQRWALRWGIRRAAILNGCAFGLLHVNFLGAGMVGFVACLLFARSRKLLVPTALHMSNNLIPFVLQAIPALVGGEGGGAGGTPDPAATPGPALFAVCSGVLLLISVPFLARFIREHWPAKEQAPPYFQCA